MTESANLRQNLLNVPSIFDISAAETLDNLIYPALNKVFDYFGLRLDFKLWGKVRIREEISPLFTWILQYTYLRNRGASFGESFYGLQRTLTQTGELPTHQQKLISATLLAFLPYVERKLQARSEQHESDNKLEHFLLRLLHVYKAAKSIHLFLYLIKHAQNHTPIFRWLGLTLRYPPTNVDENKGDIFIKLLELLAFFLQFMQWWYNNNKGQKLAGSLQNPQAAQLNSKLLEQQKIAKRQCPICLMRIDTPTACAVSGYVYCWKCIVTHLKTAKYCPVTGYGITIDDLVRIYENNN